MTVKARWEDPAGKELLSEKTEFHFIAKEQMYIIDRITTLTATGNTVSMKDTKEGMYAIRVARQLETAIKRRMFPFLTHRDGPGAEKAMRTGESQVTTGAVRA